MRSALENYKTVTDELTEEVMTLRNDNEQLRTKLHNIESNMDAKKQNELDHNFIINGIKEYENEDLNKIVTEIANIMNVELTESDIVSATRTATSNVKSGLPKTIIVRLKDKNKRELILKNKKNLRQTNNDRPIFITEQLTTRRQFILKKARDIKRKKLIEFVWVKNGNIFMRQFGLSRIKVREAAMRGEIPGRKKTDSKAVNISNIQQLKTFDEPTQ